MDDGDDDGSDLLPRGRMGTRQGSSLHYRYMKVLLTWSYKFSSGVASGALILRGVQC